MEEERWSGLGLERRARRVLGRVLGWEPSVEEGLKRSVAQAVDGLGSERVLHRSTLRSLLRVECYIRTELLGMEKRTPRYAVWRFPEREKLQRRLGEIEKERRAELVRYHGQVAGRLEDLAQALEQHAQIE